MKFSVTSTPTAVFQAGQNDGCIVTNLGPSTVFIDTTTAVSQSQSALLAPGASVEWDQGTPLFAVSLESSDLRVIMNSGVPNSDGYRYTSLPVRRVQINGVFKNVVECGSFQSLLIVKTQPNFVKGNTADLLVAAGGVVDIAIVEWYGNLTDGILIAPTDVVQFPLVGTTSQLDTTGVNVFWPRVTLTTKGNFLALSDVNNGNLVKVYGLSHAVPDGQVLFSETMVWPEGPNLTWNPGTATGFTYAQGGYSSRRVFGTANLPGANTTDKLYLQMRPGKLRIYIRTSGATSVAGTLLYLHVAPGAASDIITESLTIPVVAGTATYTLDVLHTGGDLSYIRWSAVPTVAGTILYTVTQLENY